MTVALLVVALALLLVGCVVAAFVGLTAVNVVRAGWGRLTSSAHRR